MNYYQERIETDSVIPAKIYISRSRENNGHFPLHWHLHLEFDLVLEGMITGRINGKRMEVQAGEFLFVNSGDLHETDVYDKSRTRAITLLLSYHVLKEYCPDIDSYYFDFNGKDQARQEAKESLLRCASLYEDKPEFYGLELAIELRRLCLILLTSCRQRRQDKLYNSYEQARMNNIKKAIAYMEEHYGQDISLISAAGEMGMSPPYFSRFFKKTTGETFHAYLTAIRLSFAYKELLNSDATITAIALNNGFSNVKSFIAAFTKAYGLTPAKYKRQHHNQDKK